MDFDHKLWVLAEKTHFSEFECWNFDIKWPFLKKNYWKLIEFETVFVEQWL